MEVIWSVFGIEKKLINNSGESIAEVLIALLVSSLALVILASMISSTQSIVSTSKEATKNYILEENRLIERGEPDISGSMEIKIRNNAGSWTAVKITDGHSTASIPVDYYINDENSNRQVAAYKKH